MADWFRRLPGFKPEPPGAERAILRSLPRVLVYGSLLLASPSLLVRLGERAAAGAGEASIAMSVDMLVLAVICVHWNVVLTVAIAAFIVMVMKGPAYVADAYPLVDAERPDVNAPRG